MEHAASGPAARRLLRAGMVLAVTFLNGCVVAPVTPYDVGTPVAYPAYGPYPVHGTVVYPGPYYWGPPVMALGFHGRFGAGHHGGAGWQHPRPGGGYWAPGGHRGPGGPGHRRP